MNAGRREPTEPAILPGVARPAPWLALAILILSIVACLELVAATVAIRAAVARSPRFVGSATVAIGGSGLESTDAAAARAAEILTGVPGVGRIAVLDPDVSDRLAGRLMGLADASRGAGPPRLIVITFDSSGRASAATIAQSLRSQNVPAAVDDHGIWNGPVERTIIIIASAGAAMLVILIALTWALSVASAGAAVRDRMARVELLLHLGAENATLISPYRVRNTGSAVLGALIGAGVAAGLAASVLWSPGIATWPGDLTDATIAPMLNLDAGDIAGAALWPPIAILIAALAAGGAVRARLRAFV